MKQSTQRFFLTSVLLIASVGSAFASPDEGHKKEAINAINQAKVSLSQAVTSAEQKVGGKALRASIGPSKQGWVYHVGVVDSASKVFHVTVDPNSGNVTSSEEGKHEGKQGEYGEDPHHKN